MFCPVFRARFLNERSKYASYTFCVLTLYGGRSYIVGLFQSIYAVMDVKSVKEFVGDTPILYTYGFYDRGHALGGGCLCIC